MTTDEGREQAAERRRVRWGSLAWLTVLSLIGIVQLTRRQWGDALVFGIAAVALIAEAAGVFPVLDRLRRPAVAVVAVAAAVAAALLVVVPRHSPVSAGAFALVGAAAVIVAVPPPRDGERRRWSPALRGLGWAWASIVIVACLWELLQVMLGGSTPGGRAAHPALSDLLDPVLNTLPGRIGFAVVWAGIGLFLVTRRPRR